MSQSPCSPSAPLVRLKRYEPGLRQAPHAHDAPHLSLVLAGDFRETVADGEIRPGAGQFGLRPEGLRHAVEFGADGAVILTCLPPSDSAPTIREPGWSPVLSRQHLRRLIPLLLDGGTEAAEALCDLLALVSIALPVPRPDAWIVAVRDRILDDPVETRLIDLAARTGRHRVHVGRTFLAAFGETPSVFRRRVMLNRALCLTASGVPAAAAAVDAGFADQSHFSRACRDAFGLAPGRLMRGAV